MTLVWTGPYEAICYIQPEQAKTSQRNRLEILRALPLANIIVLDHPQRNPLYPQSIQKNGHHGLFLVSLDGMRVLRVMRVAMLPGWLLSQGRNTWQDTRFIEIAAQLKSVHFIHRTIQGGDNSPIDYRATKVGKCRRVVGHVIPPSKIR